MRDLTFGVLVAVVGCTSPKPSSTPAAHATPESTQTASAVAPPPTPKPECIVDADCTIENGKKAVTVCEANRCATWDREKVRSWALGAFPDLPQSVAPPPTIDEVSWIDRKKPNTLWVDAETFWPGKAKKCVPIELTWNAGALLGVVAATYGANPKANGAVVYDLELRDYASLYGPGSTSHDAKKQTVSAWGVGEVRRIGRHLGRPFDDALRYRSGRVRLEVECEIENLQTDPRCTPCDRCVRYAMRPRSLESNWGIGHASAKKQLVASGDTPACVACPERDDKRDVLQRFTLLTETLITLHDVVAGDGLAFYRKAKDCEANRKGSAAP